MELSTIILELVLRGAGEAFKSDLGQKVFIFLMAWWVVKGTIKGHFEKIETGLNSVAQNVNMLKETMEGIEQSHSVRICKLESVVDQLKIQINNIEKE